MKTILSFILFILISCLSMAQDIVGEWKGTLNVQGTSLRIIFHIHKTDALYNVTMDSPDQNANNIPVAIVNFNNPTVKFEIPNLGMVYEGTLSDDSITGKWMQSGYTFPVVLSRDKEN